MTRADFPAWRMPFPTLPTICGRRRASRLERRREKDRRYWAGWDRAIQVHGAMAKHRQLMEGPEDIS